MKNHEEIIKEIQKKAEANIEKGYGPFFAAIYDEKGNLISEASNSVINDGCSNHHAEINAIKLAERNLKSYDLSKFNLSIYITAEPCIMCVGAIMWSGIKKVFYSVSTKNVERITGFDEGFKPNWKEEFLNRGIEVIGGIEEESGISVLEKYVNSNREIYNPTRAKNNVRRT